MKKIIEHFTPQGGSHCITNSLKQIFSYYGHPLSEAMLFGLASGLSFLYLNQSASPMINGRTKVFEFEKKLADRLNIKICCRSGKNYNRVLEKNILMINNEDPVLIYVDMPYLNYLGMDENSHFGGHAVVLFGYDDMEKKFYISDRDSYDFPIRIPGGKLSQDFHLVDYAEIEKARNSTFRPFPASNKYLSFDFDGYMEINKDTLQEAIRDTCNTMLNPPANLLGLNGILKFSKEIKKWNSYDSKKLRLAGTTNYFQISKDGGTGGGIFRKLYGEFLTEANSWLNDDDFLIIGNEFIELSLLWDGIADDLWQLSLNGDSELLEKMSVSILKIYDIEKNLYPRLLKLAD